MSLRMARSTHVEGTGTRPDYLVNHADKKIASFKIYVNRRLGVCVDFFGMYVNAMYFGMYVCRRLCLCTHCTRCVYEVCHATYTDK